MPKSLRRLSILIISLLVATVDASANHIIGGEITYECRSLGSNGFEYQFRMDIYRDCAANGADFDSEAVIGFYLRDGNNYSFWRSITVDLGDVVNVPPPDIPCVVIPPNVCVEQGAYSFSIQTSAILSQSLVATYRRCCRSRTVSNLPFDFAGATYFMEVSPRSQETCNNSPVFKSFPPSVICLNEPLEFDHSAVDMEGDSLIYQFCAPLVGGGVRGAMQGDTQADALRCDGVTPDPGTCTPRFTPITYRSGFSAAQPIPGEPDVSIDRFTGLITGTPTALGAYVVGICVTEYRDGMRIGSSQRDFQFNILACDRAVFARVEADETANRSDFLVRSCGERSVDLINNSGDARLIDSYFWEFDIRGNTEQAFEKDATFTFPGEGIYEGVMIVNRGTNCTDTAQVTVEVLPDINADFTFEYDTCIAEPVRFNNLSASDAGANALTSIDWSFGDQLFSMERHPEHLYTESGTYPVELFVEDINGCTDVVTYPVRYFPVPPLELIEPSASEGCAPQVIQFTNPSDLINSQYTVRWDFGDGQSGSEIEPNHTYSAPGTYSVDLDVTSPIGCNSSITFDDLITIRPSPIASFAFSPSNPTSIEPEVNFTDQSVDAVSWSWRLEGDSVSIAQNPTHSFQSTGLQSVVLEVTHENGCTDSVVQVIDIEPIIRYYIPDVFSPNGDASNDLFVGSGLIDGIQAFKLSIVGRWGNLVFETTDPYEGWDGRMIGTNREVPTGVYVCIVEYQDIRGKQFIRTGSITLVR